MTVSAILQTAVSSLRVNAEQAHSVARNVVNANTPGYKPQEVRNTSLVTSQGLGTAGAGVQAQLIAGDGDVDLGREFAKLLTAETSYRANAQVIRSTEDLQRQLLDIVS